MGGRGVAEVSLGEHDVFSAESEGVNHEEHKPSWLLASTSVHLGLPSQPSARGRDERQETVNRMQTIDSLIHC